MPRPRKPTSQLSPSYAGKKRVRNQRQTEPQAGGKLATRPKLPKPVAECWDALVALAPAGVLRECDVIIVEVTARQWAKLRGGRATAADVTQLRACLQQMGMTPASRSQVMSQGGEKPVNEFADV